MALLYFSPIFAVVNGSMILVCAYALRAWQRHTPRALLTVALVVGVCVGARGAFGGYEVGGLPDAAMSFGEFGMGSFLAAVLGLGVWWRLSPWKAA